MVNKIYNVAMLKLSSCCRFIFLDRLLFPLAVVLAATASRNSSNPFPLSATVSAPEAEDLSKLP